MFHRRSWRPSNMGTFCIVEAGIDAGATPFNKCTTNSAARFA